MGWLHLMRRPQLKPKLNPSTTMVANTMDLITSTTEDTMDTMDTTGDRDTITMDTMDTMDTVVIATTTSTTLVMNSRDINISIETPDLPEDSSNQTCYYA